MKIGDVVNGYRIITAPTNAGGGMSQWSFAEKGGQEFFLKMFLAPKYPLDDGPGSEASKARKRAVCLAFEQRHLSIAARLDPTAAGAGNLVIPREFFRVESTYVKVAERINATELPAAHELNPRQLMVVLRTLVFSLRLLHANGVVHGDLKPDNVLVQRGGEDLLISKLIDFDEAYEVGSPPPPSQIVGDPLYYSPETLRYIQEDPLLPAGALTTASDIFSLGLVFHAFLTGDVPAFDRTVANYPCEALNAGIPLDVSEAPVAVQSLLATMLSVVPTSRIDIDGVVSFLERVDPATLMPSPAGMRLTTARRAAPRPVPVSRPARTAAPAPAPAPTAAPAPSSPSPDGLRISMGRRGAASPPPPPEGRR